MTYTTEFDAVNNDTSTFRKQVVVAIIKAATDVINEDPGTANHANRLTWAQKVSKHDAAISEGNLRKWQVVSNATVSASLPTSLDNEVQFVVNSFINTWADEV